MARAQDARIRVVVEDSLGTPIAGASVALFRGLAQFRTLPSTDSAGQSAGVVPADSEYLELVVRRIGFLRTSRFFRPERDTAFLIKVPRAPQALAPVRVTAEEDLKHKTLFIDADAIAASTRPILDGVDIIKKLRPDMIAGRAPGCGYARNLWVNGTYYDSLVIPTNEVAIARAQGTILRKGGSASRGLIKAPANGVPDHILSALASIRPEHIAEMSYHDCTDMSLGRLHGENALFIILKPGVGFEPGTGSYVVRDSSQRVPH